MSSLRLLLLALVATAAVAQTFEEKITVSYIEVPVTVLRDGKPVRGLTKENFEVTDDGGKRAIESFEAIDFAASSETAAAISPLNPASRRNFLLLFDLSYSNPTSISRAQAAARSFIARSIGGRDLVSVGVIDVDRGFRLVTAFTTDREMLISAIADPKNFRTNDPLQISGTSTLEAAPHNASGLGEKESLGLEHLREIGAQADRLVDSRSRTRVRREVEMLSSVARALQKLAGRKHLVLLSEGFDPRIVTGRDIADETEEQEEENQAITHGEMWKVDSDKRFGSPDSMKSIDLMAEAFRKADVVLHAVDIQGVRVTNDVRGGTKFNSNAGLFLLADATGGTVFRNSNDISAEFDRLTRQHEVVYVLGFHVPVSRPGQFHNLKVKLANVPGARVQHRGGYYDPGSESTVERTLTTAEVIINDIPQEAIRVAALAASFPTDKPAAQVPVVLEIDGAGIVQAARGGIATADIFIYAFDEGGIVRDSLFQRVVLELPKVGDRLGSTGIRFYGTLRLPPGRYAIKNLVHINETDTNGYRRVDLTVPAPGDVAVVRPLFFQPADDWLMIKATRDKADLPYPFMIGGETFIPAARATLRKGEPRLFALFVYNADPDELALDIVPNATLVSQSASDEVTKYVFALDRIPENAKELGVTVRKKGSTDARTVTVPIEVQ
ncbi:MAG: VWA domain-containing protein [Thermoanaerobaculia bacterium]